MTIIIRLQSKPYLYYLLQMACSMAEGLSELEFEKSTANSDALKRVEGLRRLMKRHGMMYNPLLIRGISPDRHFNWKRIHYMNVYKTKNNQSDEKNRTQNDTSADDLPVEIRSFDKFKVRVLKDRRMCFAGRLLRGLIMPKSRRLQFWIMKSFLAWYSSCIEIGEENFMVDMSCIAEREIKFLKIFLKSLVHYWKIMPTKDLFYFI